MECAGPMYLVTLAIGFAKLVLVHKLTLVALVGTLSPPSLASLIFVILGGVVPGLVGDLKLAAPLNVTLPLVFTSALAVPVFLGPGGDHSVMQLHQMYQWAALWTLPGMLIMSTALQSILLTLMMLRRHSFSSPS